MYDPKTKSELVGAFNQGVVACLRIINSKMPEALPDKKSRDLFYSLVFDIEKICIKERSEDRQKSTS